MYKTNPRAEKFKRIIEKIYSLPFSGNLHQLAKIYRTDKGNGHNFIDHYTSHLEKFRPKKIKLLEIGVGGYDNPLKGGKSLRMWKKYFPKGEIYSIDIHDKSALQEERIKIFQGSQVDEGFLHQVLKEIGEPDIIIDDGSHINEHVVGTFKILFPFLKKGGIYFVEDTQTSYWPEYGGDSMDLENPKTMMNFFKKLTDALNYEEFKNPDYKVSYFDKHIVSMHFYHNLIVLHKGENSEGSNIQ